MLTPSAFPAIPGWGWQRRAVTATTTVVAADRGYTIDATSGTYDIALDAAATLGAGFCFGVYNSGAGTVTINPSGAETIRSPAGSAATLALSQGQGVLVMCDGTGFDVVANATIPTSGTNTGDVTLAAIGASANANGATLAGQVLNLQPASATFGGVLTAGAQSIAGAKTFTGAVTASNLSGTNTGDVTLAAVGAVPNANAASLSGQVLNLQPASTSFPGVVTTGAQTIAGDKTLSGVTTVSNATVATSATTGALVVAGGMGVSGSVYVGLTFFASIINLGEQSGANPRQILAGYNALGTGLYSIQAIQQGAGFTTLSLNEAGGSVAVGADPGGAGLVRIGGSLVIASATLVRTTVAFTDGAAAQLGTLTNAPTAGNPTKWIPIDDNGTTRYIPCW